MIFPGLLSCCGNPSVHDECEEAQASDWRELPGMQNYRVQDSMGRGAFAQVYLAEDWGNGGMVALKVVDLKQGGMCQQQAQVLRQEGGWLQQLRHPAIVTCHHILGNERFQVQVLVLEHLCGGEMLDHLHLIDHYSEAMAADLFLQVVGAVACMHTAGILHRDIKPENLVFVDSVTVCQAQNKPLQVKVVDLGMAAQFSSEKPLRGCVGSPGFAAPEVVKGCEHTPAMDVYSLGVLLFLMLYGRQPFDPQDVASMKYARKSIMTAPGVTDARFTSRSRQVRQLLLRMLSEDPQQRPSAQQLLAEPWVQAQNSEEQLCRPLDEHVRKRLAYLANLRNFKGVVNGLQGVSPAGR